MKVEIKQAVPGANPWVDPSFYFGHVQTLDLEQIVKLASAEKMGTSLQGTSEKD